MPSTYRYKLQLIDTYHWEESKNLLGPYLLRQICSLFSQISKWGFSWRVVACLHSYRDLWLSGYNISTFMIKLRRLVCRKNYYLNPHDNAGVWKKSVLVSKITPFWQQKTYNDCVMFLRFLSSRCNSKLSLVFSTQTMVKTCKFPLIYVAFVPRQKLVILFADNAALCRPS